MKEEQKIDEQSVKFCKKIQLEDQANLQNKFDRLGRILLFSVKGMAGLAVLAMLVLLPSFYDGILGKILYVLIAALIGAVCGIIILPVQLACLKKKSLQSAWPIVYVPAAIVVVGYLFWPTIPGWIDYFYPFPSALIAMVVVIIMSVVCYFVLPDDPQLVSPWLCPKCGYNLHNNRDAGCPECGWGRET